MRIDIKHRTSGIILVASLLFSAVTSSCSFAARTPKTPAPSPAPKQEAPAPAPAKKAALFAKVTLPAGTAVAEANALSPDAQAAAFIITARGKTQDLVSVDLPSGKPRILESIDAKRLEAGTLVLRVFGWNQDSQIVFARQGTQPDGKHSGRHGLSIRVADIRQPVDAKTLAPIMREVNWLPVPTGQYVNMIYDGVYGNSVFAGVGDTVWRIPLDGSAPIAVIKDLAASFGPFYPRLSPDGATFAYDRLTGESAGVHSVSSMGGRETSVAPRGKTMSFYPQWAPNSQMFAVYTAGQKMQGTTLMYDTIALEDGPLAAAATIQVFSVDGKPVASFTVPGNKLANLRWTSDSQALTFVTVQEKAPASPPAPSSTGAPLVWKEVYRANLNGETRKLMDVASPAAVDVSQLYAATQSGATYVLTRTSDNKTLLHMVEPGKTPIQIAGPANDQAFLIPPLGASVIDQNPFVVYDNADKHYLVHLAGAQSSEVSTGTENSWIVGVSGKKIAYLKEETKSAPNAVLEVFELK